MRNEYRAGHIYRAGLIVSGGMWVGLGVALLVGTATHQVVDTMLLPASAPTPPRRGPGICGLWPRVDRALLPPSYIGARYQSSARCRPRLGT
jgi:hypothetical protein